MKTNALPVILRAFAWHALILDKTPHLVLFVGTDIIPQ